MVSRTPEKTTANQLGFYLHVDDGAILSGAPATAGRSEKLSGSMGAAIEPLVRERDAERPRGARDGRLVSASPSLLLVGGGRSREVALQIPEWILGWSCFL